MESRFNLGFTLIEVMIVVSILGVLMAAAIPTFNSFNKSQILLQAVKNVKSDIRTAQNFAVSGADGKVWGIHFAPASGTYTFFKCNAGEPPNPAGYVLSSCAAAKTVTMGSTVRVTAINYNGAPVAAADLAFASVTGNLYVNGATPTGLTDIFIDFAAGASPRHVCVTENGGVREEVAAC